MRASATSSRPLSLAPGMPTSLRHSPAPHCARLRRMIRESSGLVNRPLACLYGPLAPPLPRAAAAANPRCLPQTFASQIVPASSPASLGGTSGLSHTLHGMTRHSAFAPPHARGSVIPNGNATRIARTPRSASTSSITNVERHVLSNAGASTATVCPGANGPGSTRSTRPSIQLSQRGALASNAHTVSAGAATVAAGQTLSPIALHPLSRRPSMATSPYAARQTGRAAYTARTL